MNQLATQELEKTLKAKICDTIFRGTKIKAVNETESYCYEIAFTGDTTILPERVNQRVELAGS